MLRRESWVPFDLGKILASTYVFIYFHFFLQTRQWVINFRNETSLEEFDRKDIPEALPLLFFSLYFFFLIRFLNCDPVNS